VGAQVTAFDTTRELLALKDRVARLERIVAKLADCPVHECPVSPLGADDEAKAAAFLDHATHVWQGD
jgi:hypothetical protein